MDKSYKTFKKNLRKELFSEITSNPFLKLNSTNLGDFGNISFFDVGEGPITLILHGIGETPLSYKKLIIKKARTNRVIAPFFPGYGLSSFNNKLTEKFTGFNYVEEFLAQFIQHMEINDFEIIGKDLGASVGLSYGLQYSNSKSISRITLINPIIQPMKFLSPKGLLFNIKSQVNFFETSLRFFKHKETYNLRKTYQLQIFMNNVLSEINFDSALQNIEVPIDLYYMRDGFIDIDKVIEIFNKYLPSIPAIPYAQAGIG